MSTACTIASGRDAQEISAVCKLHSAHLALVSSTLSLLLRRAISGRVENACLKPSSVALSPPVVIARAAACGPSLLGGNGRGSNRRQSSGMLLLL